MGADDTYGVMRVCGCCGELRMVSRGNENLCGQCARTVEKLTAKRYAPRPDDSEQFRRAFKFMASRRAT